MAIVAEVSTTDEDRLEIQSDMPFRDSDRIKQIPGSRHNAKLKVWTLPLSWGSYQSLYGVFGEEDLTIGPKFQEWAHEDYISRVKPATDLRLATDAVGDPRLYPFQRAGKEFLVTAKRALLCDEPGCIAGDEVLSYERAGVTRKITMRELHRKFHGGVSGHNKTWDPDISTRVKSMFADGTLLLNEIVDVVSKGQRSVLKLTLESGRTLTCTPDHQISTGIGAWSSAGDLSIGSVVMVNGETTCVRCGVPGDVIRSKAARFVGWCKKCMYRYGRSSKWKGSTGKYLSKDGYVTLSGQWDHPNADERGRLLEHIKVMTEVLGRPLAATEVVHHRDEVKTHNDPANLQLMTAPEHGTHHGRVNFRKLHGGTAGTGGTVWFTAHEDRVVGIEDAGETDVYDVEMAAPAHNFVASGVVVHNSGKTIQAIAALRSAWEDRGINPFPAIVLAPKNMTITWKKEFDKWFPGLTVSVIKGSAAQRRKIIAEPAHVYITNFEAAKSHSRLAPYGSVQLKHCIVCDKTITDPKATQAKCHRCKKELNAIPWRTVIADEAHRLQDPNSQQTRAAWSLAIRDAEFVFGLTGTPLTDAPDTLWGALHFISPDDHPTKSKYVDRFCLQSYDKWGAKILIGLNPDTKGEFFATVEPRMRRMPKEAVLPFLPEVVYSTRYVEMVSKQAKAYEQMVNGMMASVEGGIVVADGHLPRVTRLTQFSSSFAELDDEGKVRLSAPSNKVDALIEILADLGEEPVVVFAQSKQLIDLAAQALESRRITFSMIVGGQNEDQREAQKEMFQRGEVRIILCTIAAGGIGITLTRAKKAIRMQRSWSNVENIQAENRIHRIGSEIHDVIEIIDIVSTETLEIGQLSALKGKEGRLQEVVRDRETLEQLLRGGSL